MEDTETLGEYLRKERESRNLSLIEISKSTKVKEHLLKALEENQYELMPSVTYIKGFLLAYAKALGLDQNDILLRYDRALQMRSAVGQEVEPKNAVPKNSKFLWMIGGIVVIGLLSTYLLFLRRSAPRVSLPAKPPVEAVPASAPSPPVAAATVPVHVPAKVPVEEKTFSIQMKAIEETWLRFRIDGAEEKDMILKPGDVVSQEVIKRMELLVGNAGGLEIAYKGNVLKRFGKSGEVVALVATPEGVVPQKRTRQETQQNPPPSKPSP